MFRAAADHSGGAISPSRDSARRGPSLPPGWTLEQHRVLDSTNAEAHRRIIAGLSAKTAILAERQTAGRGRGARAWESAEDKGLWVSLVLPVTPPLAVLAQSTLVLAVAAHEAVERAIGLRLSVKWPNDLLHEGRKCCGLLVEANIAKAASGAPRGDASAMLILGIGLNIAHLPEDFPAALRERATSLRLIAGRECSREQILRGILDSVDYWFDLWTNQGFAPVREAWLAVNCTMGRRIVLPDGYGYAHGTAHDLAPDGALVALAGDGALLRINAGEIIFCNAPLSSPAG